MQLGAKPAAQIEKLAKHKIERLSKTAVAAEDKPAAKVERTPREKAPRVTEIEPSRRAPDQAKTDENDGDWNGPVPSFLNFGLGG